MPVVNAGLQPRSDRPDVTLVWYPPDPRAMIRGLSLCIDFMH